MATGRPVLHRSLPLAWLPLRPCARDRFLVSCGWRPTCGRSPARDCAVASWFSRLSHRPRFGPLEPWQRDQYLVVLTVALAQIGSDLSQPFLPLYVRELGVSDLQEAAFWSGLVVGV